jgi:hypothetical protein
LILAFWYWKRRFKKNSVFGPVVLEKISKDPIPFLHFCDDLPFEEDLALYLKKMNSLQPKIICTKFT